MLRNVLRASIRSIDRDLLGWRVPPVDVAFAEADWSPDEPDRYCMRCGSTIMAGPRTPHGCVRCAGDGEPRLGDRVVRLGRHEGCLRDWVLLIKYGRWTEMGLALGVLLGDAIAAVAPPLPRRAGRPVVVPMPMPFVRRLHRGIDHAAVIATGVAEALDARLCQPLRRRSTPVQVLRSGAARRAEGGVGIELRPPSDWLSRRLLDGRNRWIDWGLQGQRVVVVDDVRTTGTTLTKSVSRLRSLAPSEIIVAVLAVSEGIVGQLAPHPAVGRSIADPANFVDRMTPAP